MIRAFAAIALPESVRIDLSILQFGLPVPHTVPAESLHLTLVFLGELPEPLVEDIDLAFRQIHAPAVTVALRGLGLFGGTKPRVAWCGVTESAELRHLRAKTLSAARSAGADPEARRYVPHVTLARLPAHGVDRGQLEGFIAARATYSAPAFVAEDFRLYRSQLTRAGPAYDELARYPLG